LGLPFFTHSKAICSACLLNAIDGLLTPRHTFGLRLCAAGVPIETRKLLMGHANGDITTHYSAAELGELLAAAEKVTDRGVAQSPALTLTRRHAQRVGRCRK
jgi:hypothetical protein